MNQSLQNDIASIYKGWDSFEKEKYGQDIIDFDLTKKTEKHSFSSRTEVIKALERALADLKIEEPNNEFIKKRIVASIYFLNACLGEKISFLEYLENTLGVTPKLFSDNEVRNSFELIDDLFNQLGFRFKDDYQTAYVEKCILSDKKAVKKSTQESVSRWIKKLGQYITVPTLDRVNMDFVVADEYWANWISGSAEKGFSIKINIHERIKYLHASPSMLAAHEYCGHLIQGTQWMINAKKGSISTASSFTTVHGPEAFVMEGLSDSLAHILEGTDSLSFNELLARSLTRHRNLVNNNVHYMINMGYSFKEVLEYYKKYLPFDEVYRAESNIKDRSLSPLGRTYQYSYGAGQDYFLQLLYMNLDSKKKILTEVYKQPMTKSQLDVFIEKEKAAAQNVG